MLFPISLQDNAIRGRRCAPLTTVYVHISPRRRQTPTGLIRTLSTRLCYTTFQGRTTRSVLAVDAVVRTIMVRAPVALESQPEEVRNIPWRERRRTTGHEFDSLCQPVRLSVCSERGPCDPEYCRHHYPFSQDKRVWSENGWGCGGGKGAKLLLREATRDETE